MHCVYVHVYYYQSLPVYLILIRRSHSQCQSIHSECSHSTTHTNYYYQGQTSIKQFSYCLHTLLGCELWAGVKYSLLSCQRVASFNCGIDQESQLTTVTVTITARSGYGSSQISDNATYISILYVQLSVSYCIIFYRYLHLLYVVVHLAPHKLSCRSRRARHYLI